MQTMLYSSHHRSLLCAKCLLYVTALPQITHTHPFNGRLSGTIRVSQYQKGKTNSDFTEARDSDRSGISWAVCKSAPRSSPITTPVPHYSGFTGRMQTCQVSRISRETHAFSMSLTLSLRTVEMSRIFLLNEKQYF